MIDHIALRDRMVKRYYERPGTVWGIAQEEFPEAAPEDIAAVQRHVGAQVSEPTLSHALRAAEQLGRPLLHQRHP